MKLYCQSGACSMASYKVLNAQNILYVFERTNTEKGVTESEHNYAGIHPNRYLPALGLAPEGLLTAGEPQ